MEEVHFDSHSKAWEAKGGAATSGEGLRLFQVTVKNKQVTWVSMEDRNGQGGFAF